jgi:hypothetical protein
VWFIYNDEFKRIQRLIGGHAPTEGGTT